MTLIFHRCTFSYKRRRKPILHEFSYALSPGLSILLGPNGAGKSTMLKLAASVVRPQAGSVHLDNLDSSKAAYRARVAWMPQTITPVPSLTSREYVAYIGWLKGMNKRDAWARSREALARVDLAEKANIKTSQLSGGQLRRVGVAGALVHRAEVLLLDEPTAGMDPRQRRVFRNVLNSLAGGVRVLLSTHDVADLAEEADHVTVLNAGRVLHTGRVDSFLAHAPYGTPVARTAEAAYDSLVSAHGSDAI